MASHRILLLCGGQSEEHQVSLASARSVITSAGPEISITPLVIDRGGYLLPPNDSQKALERGEAAKRSSLDSRNSSGLAQLDPQEYDVVFPLLHGPYGEDGTVQGLLELIGLPYVGSGVLGSAVGMDKLMMKSVFASHDLPQVRYLGVNRHDWRHHQDRVLEALTIMNFPLFIKPANLGSSVGISKVTNDSEAVAALGEAFRHDRRVIVEAGVIGARELEVGVLGNEQPATSPVGEISFETEFYDYHTKYTAGRAQLTIPAEIPTEIALRCQDMAERAFLAIDAAGLARVDFFYLDKPGEVLINEINTMPGFTKTSMYPRLWAAAGIPYPELVERLLSLALEER